MAQDILVKDGASVLNKMVYAGKDILTSEKTRLEAKYPSYTFTTYADDTDTAFVNAVIDAYQEII